MKERKGRNRERKRERERKGRRRERLIKQRETKTERETESLAGHNLREKWKENEKVERNERDIDKIIQRKPILCLHSLYTMAVLFK